MISVKSTRFVTAVTSMEPASWHYASEVLSASTDWAGPLKIGPALFLRVNPASALLGAVTDQRVRKSGRRGGAERWARLFLAHGALARQFAGATDSLGFCAGPLFRRLLVGPAHLHFAPHALALHFLFQRAKSLIDIVVSNENLYQLEPHVLILA